jgi:hypothetical protein
LLLPIELDEEKTLPNGQTRKPWNVQYVSWEKFKPAILKREGKYWDFLCEADLIIGGINFCNDFL